MDDEENARIRNQDVKLWDSFQDTPSPRTSGSSVEATKKLRSYVKIIKFIISIIIFIVILGSGVISKISLFFMVSHIGEDHRVPYCDINLPDVEFEVKIPENQRIAWIWAIIFAFAVPELGTLFRSWRHCYFKNIERPTPVVFLTALIAETMHVVGLALLLIGILPKLDVIQGVMLTNCLCMIPALLNIITDFRRSRRPLIIGKGIKTILNILAFCCQLSGTFVWSLNTSHMALWLTPVAIILISFHWWENFVTRKSENRVIKQLYSIKTLLAHTRYSTYLYISIWKLFMFALSAILLSEITFTHFFGNFLLAWKAHKLEVIQKPALLNDFYRFPELTEITTDLFNHPVFSAPTAVCWTLFIQVVASFVCYVFSKFACKIKIQPFSFALPINLTVPASVCILLILSGIRQTKVCAFHGYLPDYLFFTPPPVLHLDRYLLDTSAWISILWLLSQTWITRHIWTSKANKNASTDSLFVTPLYNGLIIDQSLALNRRRKDLEDWSDMVPPNKEYTETPVKAKDSIPRVFICGTMWHEEKDEMMEFLKSILRLDEDQCSRRLARKYFELNDINIDYYKLETHIFFDDAFVKSKDQTNSDEINEYVKILILSIPAAAKEIYKTNIKIRSPKKYVTPYGGRLEWTLPGKTRMIAHLKNATKIRAKKRWSQVMYMYYLLGFKIMAQTDIDDNRKIVKSENTFILALDGDIDFQPDAVLLLINRMKVDKSLGAACGRIHPIGSGPMVWYQKFEYAIGHWLQKATEHVIGCVLCSPGCFSLFRGSALMDNSVMKKYTTESEVARHFVQYDQGEDRWLCTLILKQKYRVEYSAASDAYTHSPEGFNEFYNQRRRWIPSTMANILDLLLDAKEIVRKNDSIPMLYIWYQMLLMVGTVLGPGTIFLMLIGALVSVFSIDIWTAFLWNFIPIILFMVICYRFRKYQLMAAAILSSVYALVMMAVLVGVVIQINEDGFGSPSSIFFTIVIGQILIAGIMHPQEISCVMCIVIYYITVPSMYMLLAIYSLFNMNDVSWGTRETPKSDSTSTTEGTESIKEPIQQKEEEGLLDISFFGLFRCMLCPRPTPPKDDALLKQITVKLDQITSKAERGETNGYETRNSTTMNRPSESHSIDSNSLSAAFNIQEQSPEKSVNPDWLFDPDIKNGETGMLNPEETKFWVDLIEKYLKPHNYTKDEKNKNIKALSDLRDKCVFTFVMLNALFVLMIFVMQLNKDSLYIEWKFGATNVINFDEKTTAIMIQRTYLEIEPIGLIFVVLFGLILMIQFVCMLVHRLGTLSQILADVELDWCSIQRMSNLFGNKKSGGVNINSVDGQNTIKMVKKLQKPEPLWDENQLNKKETNIAKRRQTITKNIMILNKKNKDSSDLERNFLQNTKTMEIAKKFNFTAILNRSPNSIVRPAPIFSNNIQQNTNPVIANSTDVVANENGPIEPVFTD